MLIKLNNGNMPKGTIYSSFKNSRVYSGCSVFHLHEIIQLWLESIYPLSTSKLCCKATDASVLSAVTSVLHQAEFQVGYCLKSSNKK